MLTLRSLLRDALGDPWDRALAAWVAGMLGLRLAGADPADTGQLVLAAIGASAGAYGLLSFIVAWARDEPAV